MAARKSVVGRRVKAQSEPNSSKFKPKKNEINASLASIKHDLEVLREQGNINEALGKINKALVYFEKEMEQKTKPFSKVKISSKDKVLAKKRVAIKQLVARLNGFSEDLTFEKKEEEQQLSLQLCHHALWMAENCRSSDLFFDIAMENLECRCTLEALQENTEYQYLQNLRKLKHRDSERDAFKVPGLYQIIQKFDVIMQDSDFSEADKNEVYRETNRLMNKVLVLQPEAEVKAEIEVEVEVEVEEKSEIFSTFSSKVKKSAKTAGSLGRKAGVTSMVVGAGLIFWGGVGVAASIVSLFFTFGLSAPLTFLGVWGSIGVIGTGILMLKGGHIGKNVAGKLYDKAYQAQEKWSDVCSELEEGVETARRSNVHQSLEMLGDRPRPFSSSEGPKGEHSTLTSTSALVKRKQTTPAPFSPSSRISPTLPLSASVLPSSDDTSARHAELKASASVEAARRSNVHQSPEMLGDSPRPFSSSEGPKGEHSTLTSTSALVKRKQTTPAPFSPSSSSISPILHLGTPIFLLSRNSTSVRRNIFLSPTPFNSSLVSGDAETSDLSSTFDDGLNLSPTKNPHIVEITTPPVTPTTNITAIDESIDSSSYSSLGLLLSPNTQKPPQNPNLSPNSRAPELSSSSSTLWGKGKALPNSPVKQANTPPNSPENQTDDRSVDSSSSNSFSLCLTPPTPRKRG